MSGEQGEDDMGLGIKKGFKVAGKTAWRMGKRKVLDEIGWTPAPEDVPAAAPPEARAGAGMKTTLVAVLALAFCGWLIYMGKVDDQVVDLVILALVMLLGLSAGDAKPMTRLLRSGLEVLGSMREQDVAPLRGAGPPQQAKALRLVDVMADAITRFEGPTKNNNPGNLRNWDPTLPKDPRGFDVFPTLEAGRRALLRQVDKNVFERGLTLREFFGGGKGYGGYAPASDDNDPVSYAQFVARRLNDAGFGVGLDDRLDEVV